jgi:2',3'-cyclic-nucleotide 2'-phosphodiesterase (5'-nucleotidase family)
MKIKRGPFVPVCFLIVTVVLGMTAAIADDGVFADRDAAGRDRNDGDLNGGGGNALGCESGDLALQVIHSSDNESSFQDPNTLEPKILNFAAVVDGLQKLASDEDMESLHLTVGDHTIPGPFYQASSQVQQFGANGIADIEIYNAMKVRANGMGNHEFDGNIDDFSKMLRVAKYPFVAVNLDFSNVEQLDPETPPISIGQDRTISRRNAGRVVHSTVVKIDDQCIGLIGRAPADFFNIIANPDETLGGLDFVGGRDPETNLAYISAVEQVLDEVDALEALGVNKIFLLDHAQDFTADPLSASSLRGIDVIIAAGSTGFMAKPEPDGPFNFLRPEDTPEADYPTRRVDMEGNEVLVINSDQQYRYVGNLMIDFDADGVITDVDDRSGPIATTQEAIGLLAEEIGRNTLEADGRIRNIYERLQNTPLIQSLFTEIGTTEYPLNGLRADVRSRETNLGQLAADSTIVKTRELFPNLEIDLALKNGGGIRDTITGPSIIRLTIQAALAFDNQIAVVEMTGDQVLAAMENAVSRVPALDGRFPQVAGTRLEYDATFPGVEGQASLAAASRVRNLTLLKENGQVFNLVTNGVVDANVLNETFVMATNNFLTGGGDGYASLAAATPIVTTTIGEQEILETYIVANLGGVVDLTDPPADARVIRLDN